MAYILSQVIDAGLKFCMDHNLPAFPRTDEIVCRERDADAIRAVMARAIHRVTTVNPKIGGVRVELDDIGQLCPLPTNPIPKKPEHPIVNNKEHFEIYWNVVLDSYAA